ncbi:MAG: Gfo/Idh/MocA family oxidoreductase [Candidatus Poribacteria bacterium]|nr:Gfo/Idh/MocA family oxidoreductase [Candidatus Poribacteria bacterium]
MTQLRIAIVGVGAYESSRARGYLATIQKLNHLYSICAICDSSSQSLNEAGTQFQIPDRYRDVEKMLTTENPDVVFVLVPTDGQTVVALTAARQKCHLITEIPYALTLNYGDATAETCQQNRVKWEIAENVWLWPNEQLKQKIVQTGVLGQITHARLWYKSGNYHGFNAIRMILNSNPKQVLGFAKELDICPYDSYGGQRESTIWWENGVIEFENGVTCLYESSSASGRWGNHWEIEGTEGYLSANELVLYANQSSYPIEEIYDQVGGERILVAVAVGLKKSDSNFEPILWENPFKEYGISATDDVAKASILSSLHRAVTTGADPEYGSANARRDMELWFALRESANLNNTWVNLPLTETTNLEKRFQSAYMEAYGGDPVKNTAALLQTSFNRLSVMWSVAGWL